VEDKENEKTHQQYIRSIKLVEPTNLRIHLILSPIDSYIGFFLALFLDFYPAKRTPTQQANNKPELGCAFKPAVAF